MSYPSDFDTSKYHNYNRSYHREEQQRGRGRETRHPGERRSSGAYQAPPQHHESHHAGHRSSSGYHAPPPEHQESYHTDRRSSGGYHAPPPQRHRSHHASTRNPGTHGQEHESRDRTHPPVSYYNYPRVEPGAGPEPRRRSRSVSYTHGTPEQRENPARVNQGRPAPHGSRPEDSAGYTRRKWVESRNNGQSGPPLSREHHPEGRNKSGNARQSHQPSRTQAPSYGSYQEHPNSGFSGSYGAARPGYPPQMATHGPCRECRDSSACYSSFADDAWLPRSPAWPHEVYETQNEHETQDEYETHDVHGTPPHFYAHINQAYEWGTPPAQGWGAPPAQGRSHSTPPRMRPPRSPSPPGPKLPDSEFDFIFDSATGIIVENKKCGKESPRSLVLRYQKR